MARVANLIGFDVAKGTWATANAAIGPGDTHRLFYSGQLPATFDADGTPANVTIIASYKTQNTNVAAYVNSIPPNRNVIIIYHHEPENDYTLGSTFVSEFKSQSDLIRAQGRPNVKVAMCAEGYKYGVSGSADALAGNYLKGLGPYVDMFTVDIYQGAGGATVGWDWSANGLADFPQWTNWLSLVTNPSIVGTVQPLGITEYGVDDPVGNTARNTRIALDHDYLVSAFTPGGPSAVSAFPLQMWCYWWESITGDPNQSQFTDSATETLWSSYEAVTTATANVYLIGQTNGTGTTALTVPVSTATSAGDAIVVSAAASGSYTVTGVTDSKGNVYTLRTNDTGGVGSDAYQFSADGSNNAAVAALTTADHITVTFSGAGALQCATAVGVSGVAASPIDQHVSADNAGSATPSVTSGVLAVTGEIAIATEASGNGGGAIAWNSGWTQVGATETGPQSGPRLSVAWQVAPSTAALTASGTITSTKWTMLLTTLKPATAATTPGAIASETDFGLNTTTVLGTPAITPPNNGGSPMTNRPQLFLEAGFNPAAPVATPGTMVLDDPVNGKLNTARLGDRTRWTDITAFFRRGTITRPSSRVQGPLRTYQGATASADLDNIDGRFDPDNLNSPYVVGGQKGIRPMIPLRVRATFAGIEYHVFQGFADVWQEQPLGFDAGWSEVTVSASDGFKVLAGRILPAQTSPVGIADTSGQRINRVLSDAKWFTDHRIVNLGGSTVQSTLYGTDALSLMQLAADSDLGELYIDGSGNVVYRTRNDILTQSRSVAPVALFGDSPGAIHPVSQINGPVVNFIAGTSSDFENGLGTWTGAGNDTISLSSTQAHSGTHSLQMSSVAAGNMQAAHCTAANILTNGMPVLPNGPVNVSAWFIGTTVARSYDVGVDFYDSTGTVIGTTLRGSSVAGSTTAWTQVTATVTAPANAAFCRANLQALATAAAAEVHLADDVVLSAPLMSELYYASIGRANDDTTLANDIQIQNVGGTLQVADNDTSIAVYLFPRSYSRTDFILTTDIEALAAAQWILIVSLDAPDRFDTLTIDPLADPVNLFPQVLGREIGDRIQVWRRPQNSGAVIVKDCFIRGITHNVDVLAGTWQTVWDLDDASKYSGFFILDDSVKGKLDSGNKLAF